MRNLIGYLKKTLLLSSLSFLLLSLFTTNVFADENFTISTDITHTIASDNDVETVVNAQISTTETRVLSYYTAVILEPNLTVTCSNGQNGKTIHCTSTAKQDRTEILIDFDNTAISAKSPFNLKLEYKYKLTNSNGYSLVSSLVDTTTNSVTISYPKVKGTPLWTSDPVQNIKTVGDSYQIQIDKPVYSTTSILFGKTVAYKFQISKTFVNTQDDANQTFEIITPSDTPTQTIVWGDINPMPNTVEKDEDGNYIFKYIVAQNGSTDCSINGYILKHDTEVSTLGSTLTLSTGYWKLSSKDELNRVNSFLVSKGLTIPDGFSDIAEVDSSTAELVYKYIYQYVVNRLSPEDDLADGIITDNRKGIDNLISNPSNATPIDYSDFLVTLLRKYNIPARQVIGYVSNISGYTSDGFYNYWVEAYDSSQKRWITMDPFLEDYFGKSLYNSNFFDHIPILTRGESSVSPKLTFYKDTDFTITSDVQADVSPKFDVQAQLVFDNNNILSKYIKGIVNISNTGNIAINGYNITKSGISNLQRYIDPVNNINSLVIIPKENATLQFNIPNTKSLSDAYIQIEFKNNEATKSVMLQTDPYISTPLYIQIIAKVFSVTIFVSLCFLIYFLIQKGIKKYKHG